MMDEKTYNALTDMFASAGWKVFMEDVKQLEDSVTRAAVDQADTGDKWQYCRGQTHQLRSILGYSIAVKASWDQALKDAEEDDADSA